MSQISCCRYTDTIDINIVFQLLSCVQIFVTPWTAACKPSLSFTISRSLLKLMSTELVMLSNRLILCWPPSFPASGSFPMSWLFASGGRYWSFTFSISPSSEYSGLISFRIDWFDPMDCSRPGSFVHELSWQEYWSGLTFLPPGDLPDPGVEAASPVSTALQVDSSLLSQQGSPDKNINTVLLLPSRSLKSFSSQEHRLWKWWLIHHRLF